MSQKRLSRALSLERFAAGKDGRVNAYKKKKQANKRKLFEKAQLKRRYAKLLKKEGLANTSSLTHESQQTRCDPTDDIAYTDVEGEPGSSAPSVAERRPEETAVTEDRNQGCSIKEDDGQNRRRVGERKRRREQHAEGTGRTKSEKRETPLQQHRPDPFKEAKAKAEQRRLEKEEAHEERERQRTEKQSKAKQRRKKHALLSKRTKGGQPVMKHTMQHLLEKIQGQA
ncbi:unnamed protein product [Ascophyllum nodosum]